MMSNHFTGQVGLGVSYLVVTLFGSIACAMSQFCVLQICSIGSLRSCSSSDCFSKVMPPRKKRRPASGDDLSAKKSRHDRQGAKATDPECAGGPESSDSIGDSSKYNYFMMLILCLGLYLRKKIGNLSHQKLVSSNRLIFWNLGGTSVYFY